MAQSSVYWSSLQKAEMASRVKTEFLHTWKGYRQYAWGHDELNPISKTPRDWYGVSLMMTPVDALDTLIIMGFDQEAKDTRELIATQLNFNQDVDVKAFEISIRLIGGLLSSYQLSGDKRLLAKADDLATRLLPIFESPTGMPYVMVNLKTGKASGTGTNPAEVGSYLLEFGTLSKLTGKPVYYEKAKRAMTELYKRRSPLGLYGLWIDSGTGKWTSDTMSVGSMMDAYIEYTLKCAKLLGDKDCEKMWREAIGPINKYLADESTGGLWYGQANIYTGQRVGQQFGALDAYFPALLALSGDLDRAKKLQDSCYRMWTLHGIEPEGLDYKKMEVTSGGYPLRPEIVESAYYLYTYTHDPKYLDMGKVFFDDLIRYCKTDAAFATMNNVVTHEKADSMESFFFAETMKYFYLLYAPAKKLDFNKIIFNTEAHPLRKSWK